ncbi:50S ribosomal protein L33, putative [Babesia microti strain RI]|uniref:50S ribosomal protein L33, putative n=1 Tax=Babesia microti (strain RI) TaxID=1133968 RepID=A0A1N6LX86_BABMR|nr:50S ribosomal protein L33, putative [Babesia microti strain RI]SIO73499.1 50S ribosomal protein L33, putative [Babesia microti strain RI]|eukprot:XP_021337594.1 50S ribosomal protein L33, putative [Babesia microti strain RI]
MFFLTNVLLKCNSKRLVVRLDSSVSSGYYYLTRISPLKAKHRMALRKHDPRVNKHVVFYQIGPAGSTQTKPPTLHSAKYARFVGKNKNMRPLLARVERAYEYGKFHAFDRAYPRLVSNRARTLPRMQ